MLARGGAIRHTGLGLEALFGLVEYLQVPEVRLQHHTDGRIVPNLPKLPCVLRIEVAEGGVDHGWMFGYTNGPHVLQQAVDPMPMCSGRSPPHA